MKNSSFNDNNINCVTNFQDLVTIPFKGNMNAVCWVRNLTGDFSEIVNKIALNENLMVLDEDDLCELVLREQGQIARKILLNDLQLLKAHGALPNLNLIRYYDKDDTYPFFPTDVYSFHVDRSPAPTDTILCTYHGASSEILPNAQAEQKVLVPEIRDRLKHIYIGPEEEFESFLKE